MAQIEGPLKEIKFLHMDNPNETIPTGFAVCDGSTLTSTQQDINPGSTYTLPDMRNCFILIADPTKAAGQAGVAVGNANINAAAGAPGPKSITGENQHTTVSSEMPSHNHGGGVHSHAVGDTGHTHANTLALPNHSHSHSLSLPTHIHAHSLSLPSHVHRTNDTVGGYLALQDVANVGGGGGGNSVVNNRVDMNSIFTSNPTSNPAISGAIGNNSTSPAITGTVDTPTTNPAITGSVTSTTTGVTITNSAAVITTNGSDGPHENRPRAYGLVAIMRVKL
jgi:hypothetical protein